MRPRGPGAKLNDGTCSWPFIQSDIVSHDCRRSVSVDDGVGVGVRAAAAGRKGGRRYNVIHYKVLISCCDRVEKCVPTTNRPTANAVESKEEGEEKESALSVCEGDDDGGAGPVTAQ